MTGPRVAVLVAVVVLVASTIAGMVVLVVSGHGDAAPGIAAITAPLVSVLLLGQGQRETRQAVSEVHELVNSQATHLADAAATTIAAKDETIAAPQEAHP